MRNILLTFSVLVFMLLLPYSAAQAGDVEVDETNTIPENGSYIIQINNIEIGDTLNSDVQIVGGGPIDMFLIDSAYYETFLNRVSTIDVIKGSYATGVTSNKYNYIFDKPGDYYLILDNSNSYGKTASSGTVDAHIKISINMKNQTNASISTSTSTRGATQTQVPTSAITSTIPASPTQGTPGFELALMILALGLAAFLRER